MTRFVPLLFVLLWSTGFIGARFGLPYAEPFTMLSWRMLFVVPIFLLLISLLGRSRISPVDALVQGLVGLLIHGAYLGGTFAAIATGMPTGLTALLLSTSPLFVAILSGLVLGDRTTPIQWLALLLGLVGVLVVLSGAARFDGNIGITGLGWLSFALAGICAGTLVQKRYAGHVDLVTGSFWQYSTSLVFFFLMSLSLESRQVDWSLPFVLTLAWLIIVLSLVAVLLLLYMIRHGEATRVSSYFYLVPPLTALQGWLFFGEQWRWNTLFGAAIVIFALLLYKYSQDRQLNRKPA